MVYHQKPLLSCNIQWSNLNINITQSVMSHVIHIVYYYLPWCSAAGPLDVINNSSWSSRCPVRLSLNSFSWWWTSGDCLKFPVILVVNKSWCGFGKTWLNVVVVKSNWSNNYDTENSLGQKIFQKYCVHINFVFSYSPRFVYECSNLKSVTSTNEIIVRCIIYIHKIRRNLFDFSWMFTV